MTFAEFFTTRRSTIATATAIAIATVAGVAFAGAPAASASEVMFADAPVGAMYAYLDDAGVMPGAPLPAPQDAPTASFDHEYGLDDDTLAAGQMVAGIWGVTDIGGYATGGHVSGSDHYTGNALDIMLTPVTEESIELGWEISYWLEDNAEELNIYYIIFNGKIWKAYDAEAGWQPYSHPTGGTSDEYAHHDHIHVSFY